MYSHKPRNEERSNARDRKEKISFNENKQPSHINIDRNMKEPGGHNRRGTDMRISLENDLYERQSI